MSLYDQYQELELYLEQAHDEINHALDDQYSNKQISMNGNISSSEKLNVFDWDCKCSSLIDTEIDEILTKCKEYTDKAKANNCNLNNVEQINNTKNDDDILIENVPDLINIPDYTSTDSLNQLLKDAGVNTGIQTSPSESLTNLTWSSDCSLSPYLTPDSDGKDDKTLYAMENIDQLVIRPQWQKSLSTSVLKNITKVSKQARSQSDRHLSEIEATEACKWLRAAGFPQYAQMYEDMQFPVDIEAAEQDHPLLEPSVLHSLFRRLQILNRCAQIHQQRVSHTDDSEEEQCALSDKWAYQSDVRRWSRTVEIPSSDEFHLLRRNNHVQDKDESSKLECLKDTIRRAISPSCRRRRDEIVINNSSVNVLELLSKQLGDFHTGENKILETNSLTRRSRRRKTGSLDKTDITWSQIPHTTDTPSWHTIHKSEDIEDEIVTDQDEHQGRSIYSLSSTQLQVLRKLALLKLTAHMEKYCPSHKTGWNWDLSKFIRKMKSPLYKDKTVFGVPLTIVLQRTGLPLPKAIEEVLHWLKQNAADNVGIFRKPGVRSRIQILKSMIDIQGENVNFKDHQAYDVADTLKQYFRELPEALLTNKLSETFISIFQHVPKNLRREAVLCGLLLMPDEHREVLQTLLIFLHTIAQHSLENQMNESNLALCFAPTLFYHNQVANRQGSGGAPYPKELDENRAAHDCLLFLIKNCNNICNIPIGLLNQCNSSEMKDSVVVHLTELGMKSNGDWKSYLQACQCALLKEVREKTRGWINIPSHYDKIEISYKKVADHHPLRLWKVTSEIEASPSQILRRLLTERHIWDENLQSTRTISEIDNSTDIFQYSRKNVDSLPVEDYCVVRSWRDNLPKGACLIVETSIEHPDAVSMPNSVRGIVLASRYLIEVSGSLSRLIHLSRIDIRGKMPEWYHKNYAHICALHMFNIYTSFHKVTTKKLDVNDQFMFLKSHHK